MMEVKYAKKELCGAHIGSAAFPLLCLGGVQLFLLVKMQKKVKFAKTEQFGALLTMNAFHEIYRGDVLEQLIEKNQFNKKIIRS